MGSEHLLQDDVVAELIAARYVGETELLRRKADGLSRAGSPVLDETRQDSTTTFSSATIETASPSGLRCVNVNCLKNVPLLTASKSIGEHESTASSH